MATSRATILVVDDDPLGRDGFAGLLRDAGFEVQEAATGEEALRLSADRNPDLILLDVLLPDVGGYEVCRRLKAVPTTASTLVLLVSGLGVRSEDRVLGLEGGADGYLAKPVDPAELVAQARALLRARQAEDAVARQTLLLANVRDSVIVTDPAGVVTFWNMGATHLFGWTAGEMVGQPLAKRLPEHERTGMEEMLWAIATGADWRGERHDYRKDGSRIWVEGRASRITDAAGRVVGILGLANDISDRKRSEADRELLIGQLQEALSAVKTLRGLVPLCAWCKQVRNDRGSWRQLEAYLQENLDVSVTHGICPACAEQFVTEESSPSPG
jgi:PAS domain S-box-containing protein